MSTTDKLSSLVQSAITKSGGKEFALFFLLGHPGRYGRPDIPPRWLAMLDDELPNLYRDAPALFESEGYTAEEAVRRLIEAIP